jgi:hypothetical protein
MQQTLNRSIPWTVDGRVALAATRALEPIALLAAFTAILMFFRAYAIETAGGSDAYGYVSEAQRLTQGRFYEPERVFSPFGLSEKSSISHPLGYRPLGAEGTVPTYPFGYPLLMAAFVMVAGTQAAFWVTPLMAAGTVVVTYLLGRAWLGRAGGLLAALVVLVFPNFLFGAVQPMSDVPAAFLSALALLLLLRPQPRRWSDALLGVVVGFAIWVRPNSFLIVILVLAWLSWRREYGRLFWFAGALLPFILVEGWVNHALYGSPFSTGYGDQQVVKKVSAVGGRAGSMLRRIHDQQAGLGVALIMGAVAVSRLPVPHRVFLVGMTGLFVVFYGFIPFADETWWWGRYLLPVLPALALLEAGLVVRLLEPGPELRLRAGVLAVGLALFSLLSVEYARTRHVFDLAVGERKYQTAAHFVRERVSEPAIILAMQHSGSLRFYGGYPTARYDVAPLPELVAKLREVAQAGGSVYLLAEGWELEQIRNSDRSKLLAGAQEVGYFEPSRVTLFRLDPFS